MDEQIPSSASEQRSVFGGIFEPEQQPLNIVIVHLWIGLVCTILISITLLLLTIYQGAGGIGTGMLLLLSLPVIPFVIFSLFFVSANEIRNARKKKQVSHLVHKVTLAISLLILLLPLAYAAFLLATRPDIRNIFTRQDPLPTTSFTDGETKISKKLAAEVSETKKLEEARNNAIAAVTFIPFGASGTDITGLNKTKQYMLLKSPTKEVQAGGWSVSFRVKMDEGSSYSFYLFEVQQPGQTSACAGGQLSLGLGACEDVFTTPNGTRVSKAAGGGRYHYFVKDNIFFQMDATSTSSNGVVISTVIDRLQQL